MCISGKLLASFLYSSFPLNVQHACAATNYSIKAGMLAKACTNACFSLIAGDLSQKCVSKVCLKSVVSKVCLKSVS